MDLARFTNVSIELLKGIKEFRACLLTASLSTSLLADARACKRIPDINLPTSVLHSAAKNVGASVRSTILPAIHATPFQASTYDSAVSMSGE